MSVPIVTFSIGHAHTGKFLLNYCHNGNPPLKGDSLYCRLLEESTSTVDLAAKYFFFCKNFLGNFKNCILNICSKLGLGTLKTEIVYLFEVHFFKPEKILLFTITYNNFYFILAFTFHISHTLISHLTVKVHFISQLQIKN